jgi:copper chaperone CopZ
MKSITLKIEGMRCSGCAETIRALVSAQPGVHGADVSFEDGQARVLYDPKSVEEDRLVETIQKPGYRVVARS